MSNRAKTELNIPLCMKDKCMMSNLQNVYSTWYSFNTHVMPSYYYVNEFSKVDLLIIFPGA